MYKLRNKIGSNILNIATVIAVIFSIFPLLWLISTSLKTKSDAFAVPPKLLFVPNFSNYAELFVNADFMRSLLNSFIVTIWTTVFAIVLGVAAGYALTHNKTRLGKSMGMWIILARMIPPMGIIIPFFLIFSYLGLTDNVLTLILIYLTTVLPFVTWLMMGFFKGIPAEIDEAALIDGCTRVSTLLKIDIPIVMPGIATCGIFSFMMAWNEFFYAVIMTGKNTKTVPIAVQSFVNSSGTNWGSLSAASVIVIMPILVFTAISQKSFVRGLMGGAVKG